MFGSSKWSLPNSNENEQFSTLPRAGTGASGSLFISRSKQLPAGTQRDQADLKLWRRYFVGSFIIVSLIFMVMAGAVCDISIYGTEKIDHQKAESSGHLDIPRKVGDSFAGKQKLQQNAQNLSSSFVNSSNQDANSTKAPRVGLILEEFSHGWLQRSSGVPTTSLTKAAQKNFSTKIIALKEILFGSTLEDPQPAAENSNLDHQTRATLTEAEPDVDDGNKSKEITPRQLQKSGVALQFKPQHVLRDFMTEPSYKFKNSLHVFSVKNKSPVMSSLEKHEQSNVDSFAENFVQPRNYIDEFMQNYGSIRSGSTNITQHHHHDVMKLQDIASFILGGNTRQTTAPPLKTFNSKTTRKLSKLPRSWRTIMRQLSTNFSSTSGPDASVPLASSDLELLLLTWLDLFKWGVENGSLPTNFVTNVPGDSREEFGARRVRMILNEISSVRNRTVELPLLISSVDLPITQNFLFFLTGRNRDSSKFRNRPRFSIEVCVEDHSNVTKLGKRSKRSIYRPVNRNRMPQSPLYKHARRQDIVNNFGLNKLSPQQRKSNFLTVTPDMFNCYGSTSLCFFCYIYLFYTETNLDPGACMGACAVAVGGSCGLLFGKGVQRMGQQTVICTELYRQGLMTPEAYEADAKFGLRMEMDHPEAMVTYRHIAKPVVALMQKSQYFTALIEMLSRPCRQHMEYVEGLSNSDCVSGKIFLFLSVRGLTILWYAAKLKTQICLASFLVLVTSVTVKFRKGSLKVSSL